MSILVKNVVQGANASTLQVLPSLGAASIGDLVVVAIGHAEAGNTGTSVTDNAGNTYTKIAARNDGTVGAALYYSVLTAANAGLVVTADETATSGAVPVITAMAWLIGGISAYNADQSNAANFSGSSTAWTVGPTTLTPPAGSIFIYVGSAEATETGLGDAAGYNTVGANGFTSGMQTAASQLTFDASNVPCFTGYKISSAAETPGITLPAAANWFGVVASFAPTGGGSPPANDDGAPHLLHRPVRDDTIVTVFM